MYNGFVANNKLWNTPRCTLEMARLFCQIQTHSFHSVGKMLLVCKCVNTELYRVLVVRHDCCLIIWLFAVLLGYVVIRLNYGIYQ